MLIQNGVGIFTVAYFFLRLSRMRKYKKESIDEMAENNLKRCDAICFKIIVLALIVIAFVSAILRMISSSEVIGYCLVGLLFIISVVRTILFGLMDKKGL